MQVGPSHDDIGHFDLYPRIVCTVCRWSLGELFLLRGFQRAITKSFFHAPTPHAACMHASVRRTPQVKATAGVTLTLANGSMPLTMYPLGHPKFDERRRVLNAVCPTPASSNKEDKDVSGPAAPCIICYARFQSSCAHIRIHMHMHASMHTWCERAHSMLYVPVPMICSSAPCMLTLCSVSRILLMTLLALTRTSWGKSQQGWRSQQSRARWCQESAPQSVREFLAHAHMYSECFRDHQQCHQPAMYATRVRDAADSGGA